MSRAILLVSIRGQVQGVGFRAWVASRAQTAKLEGWVRNRSDGSVEALFAGPVGIVAEMVALCRHGPSSAKVEQVFDQAASPDALNLRRSGERFSTLPTL